MLIALGRYEWGGFKTVVDSLAKYMSMLGVEVSIAALKLGDIGLKNEISWKIKILSPKQFINEAKLYDVVHIHTTYPYTKAAIKAGLRNIVFTYHGYCPWHIVPGLRNKLVHLALKHMYRRLLPELPVITAISSFVKRQLKYIFGINEAEIVYNGVDLELFRPIDVTERNGYPILFNAMAYEKLKGLDLALRYFKVIKDFYPEAKLMLRAISSKSVRIIKNYCNKFKMKLERDIKLLPYMPQKKLAYYYSLADIYFLTSRWESFCLPMVEAFACGTPVLALYNDDARVEHIAMSRAGEFFSDEKSLISGVDRILRSIHSYSVKALEYARKLDWRRIVKRYLKVYEKVSQY